MRDLAFDHWDDLLKLVLAEDAHLLDKWGYQDHPVNTWLNFLVEEVGELAKAISEHEFRQGSREAITEEAIQVSTLALKMAEMNLYHWQADLPISEDTHDPCAGCQHEEGEDICMKCLPPDWPKFKHSCDHHRSMIFYQQSPPAAREAKGWYCRGCSKSFGEEDPR